MMASWHACVAAWLTDDASDPRAFGVVNRRPCTVSTAVPAGERFVIDPYSEGMLLPESEVGLGAGWGMTWLSVCVPAGLAVVLPPVLQPGRLLRLPLAHATLSQGRDELATLHVIQLRLIIQLLPKQVKELFGVEGELRPCSNEEMLAAMLGVLRDTHWCAAHAVQLAAIVRAALLCLAAPGQLHHTSKPSCPPYPLPAGVLQLAARQSPSGLCPSM